MHSQVVVPHEHGPLATLVCLTLAEVTPLLLGSGRAKQQVLHDVHALPLRLVVMDMECEQQAHAGGQ
eukprot:6343593-Alexandrium_andersonii.AAC.1